MRMKFRFLQHVLLPVLLLCLMACSTNNSTLVNGGNGLLFVTAQANTTVSVYGINLSNGALSTVGSSIGTGTAPAAIAITPALDAMFISNTGSNDISSYTTNSDGSLSAVSGTTKAGIRPMGLAIDPAGKFLFVANQGSSSVSAFTIGTGGALTAVPGSPFTTIPDRTFRIRSVRYRLGLRSAARESSCTWRTSWQILSLCFRLIPPRVRLPRRELLFMQREIRLRD